MSSSNTDLVSIRAISFGSFFGNISLSNFPGIVSLISTKDCPPLKLSSLDKRKLDQIMDRELHHPHKLKHLQKVLLRRMIMGFIFELKQPIFFFSIDIDWYYNRTSIDFFRKINIFNFTTTTQIFTHNGCHIHQSNRRCYIEFFSEF